MAYPRRFDPAKKYLGVEFTDTDRAAHSHDFNDLQDVIDWRLKAVGNYLIGNGRVVEGGGPVIDQITGEVTMPAGQVYIDGAIHHVPEATFTIPTTGELNIGVFAVTDYVSHLTDPDLVGKVTGTRAYAEPGQDRRRVQVVWGWGGMSSPPDGPFYPIYLVINLTVIIDNGPELDPFADQLERYDREANGHYIVKGWRVKALGPQDGDQIFSIEEGTVNVWGRKIDRYSALRLARTEDPDLLRINAEPHVAVGGAGEVVPVNRKPQWDNVSVTILKEKTVTLTHGGFAGAVDALPDTAVASIVEVVQGATTYAATTDYTLSGDSVDWTPAGAEPAPGSSYDVTYRYLETDDPDEWDADSVTVSGAVAGSTVLITYDWALPRVDTMSVDKEGRLHYKRGQSAMVNPRASATPVQNLKIAEVANNWGAAPTVKNVGTRAQHFNKLELLGELVIDLYDLVAQERLKTDASAREVAAKRGLFVDPFNDDDLRDAGIPQTAAIANGGLRLPIAATTEDIELGALPILLNYTEEIVASQLLKTDCQKINPYQVFVTLPGTIELDPGVDFWVDHATDWSSDVTAVFVREGNAQTAGTQETTLTIAELRSAQTEASVLRQRTVNYTIKGFGAGEVLQSLTFDGIDITPA